jgi:hypothetical protein
MIKNISALLALMVIFFAGLALANTAVVTSMTGTVRAQTGPDPARVLRVGDEVRQGDTISTAPVSSVVLKFDDGQVAALTANSRMTITAYQYNPAAGSGNVLLSLVDGGMRAITGLIGRRTPNNVAYRAASATIGIRGTDVTIATSLGNVVVTVTEGVISFTFAGRTVTVSAGQGVNARTDGTFQQGAAAQILSQIPADLAASIGGLQGLATAIAEAGAGTPRDGISGEPGSSTGTSTPPSGPTGGGAGGGTASPS